MSNSGSGRHITHQATVLRREVYDQVLAALLSGDLRDRMNAVAVFTSAVPRFWTTSAEDETFSLLTGPPIDQSPDDEPPPSPT